MKDGFFSLLIGLTCKIATAIKLNDDVRIEFISLCFGMISPLSSQPILQLTLWLCRLAHFRFLCFFSLSFALLVFFGCTVFLIRCASSEALCYHSFFASFKRNRNCFVSPITDNIFSSSRIHAWVCVLCGVSARLCNNKLHVYSVDVCSNGATEQCILFLSELLNRLIHMKKHTQTLIAHTHM